MRSTLALLLLTSCYTNHGRIGDETGDPAQTDDTDPSTDSDSGDGGSGGNGGGGDDSDSGGSGSRPDPVDVTWDIEITKTGKMTDLVDPRQAVVNKPTNYPYVLEAPNTEGTGGKVVHYLMSTYVYPTGDDDTPDDYCVDGEVDETTGTCRGKVWTAGRITSTKPTQHMCFDQANGRVFLVKDQGEKIEVSDTSIEGEEAYSFNFASGKIDIPEEVRDLGKFLGQCEYLAYSDELLLSGNATDSAATSGFVKLTASEDPGVMNSYTDLGILPGHLYALGDGHSVLSDDLASSALVRIDTTDMGVEASWTLDPFQHFGVNRRTGMAYIAHGSGGAGMLDTSDPSSSEVAISGITGTVEWAFADETRNLGWFVATDNGSQYTVYLVKDGAVTGQMDVPGDPVVMVAEPGDMGDLVVYQKGAAADSGAWTVFGAKPDGSDGRPPVKVYLYTTIEEPSDSNLWEDDAKTRYNCDYYENELVLIRANAAQLASLRTADGQPVPIAMAITDNFAEISQGCGGAEEIYDELQNVYGFELGVMLHNRPCYNCSSSDGTTDADGLTSNPDYCGADHPNFIAPTNSTACFPDDPEYCPLGDFDCYHDFLAPRVEMADRPIPGGGSFIVGADRHGMWDYDWLRLYQDVERPDHGLTGFDLTMFVGVWAYDVVEYGDPREKNPATWRPQDRAAVWRPGQINDWSRDSAYSNLVYLPGINSATNKIGEQQMSSLYMVDFVTSGISIAYDQTDFDVQWQHLRQAVNYRKPDAVNTWYWHIMDTGLSNLARADGSITAMSDNPKITVTQAMQEFVNQIDERYVATGEVEWAYPTTIKEEYQACCAW